jgi:preprotein translocase subunit SecF
LIDLSINETLSRTVLTATTTAIALLILYLFGSEVIKSFTFAMLFGVIIGTYSSIFVASAIVMYTGVTREWGSGLQSTRGKANASKA